MSAIYLILMMLCLIGLAIRTCYEWLKHIDRVNTKSTLVFAIVFVGMGLMLLSWPFLSLFDPFPLAFPGAIRWAGLCVVMIGVGLAVGGVIQLKGVENIDHLVSDGVFARLRHPMYTGFIL